MSDEMEKKVQMVGPAGSIVVKESQVKFYESRDYEVQEGREPRPSSKDIDLDKPEPIVKHGNVASLDFDDEDDEDEEYEEDE